jgi:16S rRNA (uracil1498-N3)-methyltransferase
LDHFYQPDITSGILYLDEDESKHCVRVLRKKAGDEIIVLDGKGGIYTCMIIDPQHNKTKFEIIEKRFVEKPAHFIHLSVAPTKNIQRIEWLLEKCIEVGVQSITFLNCKNSERKRVNKERMIKKAINALKQSKNVHLPVINDIKPFIEFIDNHDSGSGKYICHADTGHGNYLLNKAMKGSSYQVIIGPEGDFSEEELRLAEKYGFEPVSLGKTRLRTETAGLVACILLNALNIKD